MESHQLDNSEKRRSPRERRSDAIFWRLVGQTEYDMGWILEASDDGLAFAWRGDAAPPRGSIVEVHRGGGAGGGGDEGCERGRFDDLTSKPERALVRRSTLAHDDLAIIAVQIIPEMSAAKGACEVALKPRTARAAYSLT